MSVFRFRARILNFGALFLIGFGIAFGVECLGLSSVSLADPTPRSGTPQIQLAWSVVPGFPSVDEVAERAPWARDLTRVLDLLEPRIELINFRTRLEPVLGQTGAQKVVADLSEIRLRLQVWHRDEGDRAKRARELEQKVRKLWAAAVPSISKYWSLTEVLSSGDAQWDEDTVRVEIERLVRMIWDRVDLQLGALAEGRVRGDLLISRKPVGPRVSIPLRYEPEGVTAKVALWINGRWASGRFLIDPSVERSVLSPEWLGTQGFLIYEAIRPGIPASRVTPIPALAKLTYAAPGGARRAGLSLPLLAETVSWGGLEIDSVPFASFGIEQPLLFGLKTTCCAGVLGWDWLRRFQIEFEGGPTPRLWVSRGGPVHPENGLWTKVWERAEFGRSSFAKWFTDREAQWYLDGPAGRWTRLREDYLGPLSRSDLIRENSK